MDNAQTLLSMPGVGFFGMLIIGILAGYIAEKVTSSDHGLLTNLLVGIAGSFVGGTLANVLKIEFHGWLGNLARGLDRRHPRIVDLAERQRPRHTVSLEFAAMVTLLIGQTDVKARPRHPEKARLPDTPVLPKPAWIRVRAPGAHDIRRDARGAARASPRHRVRGGGLPEYRRVLGQAPRHLHDHGRYLHARLRLLQCSHRESPARSMHRAGPRGQRRRRARPRPCGGDLGRSRRSR